MTLVDTLAEQALLEQLLDSSKPTIPAECRHLHSLLSTPFRDGAVYPSGSRFRRAGLTPGVFYGSQSAPIAIAEMAFYRLLFFAESPGQAGTSRCSRARHSRRGNHSSGRSGASRSARPASAQYARFPSSVWRSSVRRLPTIRASPRCDGPGRRWARGDCRR